MLKGIFLLGGDAFNKIYGPQERQDVEALIDVYAPPQTAASVAENPGVLAEAEVILSGWGMAKMDEAFLAAAPKLKAVFYGAGSIRGFATDAAWDRGIMITSAYAANAIPTAEFALAQILIALKRGWYFNRLIQREGKYLPKEQVARIDESYLIPESPWKSLAVERRAPQYLDVLRESYLFKALEIAWRASEDRGIVMSIVPDSADAEAVHSLFLEWKGLEE